MAAELDLNLLRVFAALLDESSVTGAAERLHLSVPATSRALGRLRRALGDPILVRAGRGLVPTPFALATAPRVRSLLDGAQALFRADRDLDLATLERTFTIRCNDGIAAVLGAVLRCSVAEHAPNVRVRFVPEGDEDIEALRDGSIDLDIGRHTEVPADLRVEPLFTSRLVGIVARGTALSRGRITPVRFCGATHISVSRRGRAHGPIDDALAGLGLQREVGAVVSSFSLAALLVADSELVGSIPAVLAEHLAGRLALRLFDLPVATPALPVGQQWHARLDADPASRWLREQVRLAGSIAAEPATRPGRPTAAERRRRG